MFTALCAFRNEALVSSHSRFLPQRRAGDDAVLADTARIITLGSSGTVTQNASFSSSSVDLSQAGEALALLFVQIDRTRYIYGVILIPRDSRSSTSYLHSLF